MEPWGGSTGEILFDARIRSEYYEKYSCFLWSGGAPHNIFCPDALDEKTRTGGYIQFRPSAGTNSAGESRDVAFAIGHELRHAWRSLFGLRKNDQVKEHQEMNPSDTYMARRLGIPLKQIKRGDDGFEGASNSTRCGPLVLAAILLFALGSNDVRAQGIGLYGVAGNSELVVGQDSLTYGKTEEISGRELASKLRLKMPFVSKVKSVRATSYDGVPCRLEIVFSRRPSPSAFRRFSRALFPDVDATEFTVPTYESTEMTVFRFSNSGVATWLKPSAFTASSERFSRNASTIAGERLVAEKAKRAATTDKREETSRKR